MMQSSRKKEGLCTPSPPAPLYVRIKYMAVRGSDQRRQWPQFAYTLPSPCHHRGARSGTPVTLMPQQSAKCQLQALGHFWRSGVGAQHTAHARRAGEGKCFPQARVSPPCTTLARTALSWSAALRLIPRRTWEHKRSWAATTTGSAFVTTRPLPLCELPTTPAGMRHGHAHALESARSVG